jgi:hypothetical protein
VNVRNFFVTSRPVERAAEAAWLLDLVRRKPVGPRTRLVAQVRRLEAHVAEADRVLGREGEIRRAA